MLAAVRSELLLIVAAFGIVFLAVVGTLLLAWVMYLAGPPPSIAPTATGRPSPCISAEEAAK